MDKPTVLIVDDVEINREILFEILQDNYNTIQAANGYEAVEAVMANADKLSCILLDIMMPELSGYDVINILKSGGFMPRIPVIIITADSGDLNEVKGLNYGASDVLGKPFNPDVVKCRVAAQVELQRHRNNLEELVAFNVSKVEHMRDSMLEIMATVIEYRNVESGQHVKRTKIMGEQLFELLRRSGKLSAELTGIDIPSAVKAIPLHDIGKIGIPDNILLKPGRLLPEEFEVIKKHTLLGTEIIDSLKEFEDSDYIRYCREICLYHHERWDGFGYPTGLKGKDIPITARVMSVVDVYDALTSQRVYKPSMTHQAAVDLIVENAGKQFDPDIIKVFAESSLVFDTIVKNYQDVHFEVI
ncbi:MAG: response regulator [Clostridiales bacterium]|jgi:putative two-component system response regulator|nr:response regulator [Clostridiales bacterium]